MISNHKEGIDIALRCAQACRECAAACLSEPDVHMMARCIQTDLACAAICEATAEAMLQNINQANRLSQVCAEICTACAEECEKHEHEHCKRCAEACRQCADVLIAMAGA